MRFVLDDGDVGECEGWDCGGGEGRFCWVSRSYRNGLSCGFDGLSGHAVSSPKAGLLYIQRRAEVLLFKLGNYDWKIEIET